MRQPLLFDLDFTTARTRKLGALARRKRADIQRAILKWLEEENPPTGMALNVVTRISRLRGDVAAFWSTPVKNNHSEGPGQILQPVRTAIVQCHTEREDCWPDCLKSQEILPKLREHKERLQMVETRVRREEPNLRETNTLFEEFAEWRYEDTEDREYHELKRGIEKMEHGLYHGTKFERIRSAQLADSLYLAVPAGVVAANELADGWGLLWVNDDLTVRVIAEPETRACLPSNRVHLVQNIAAAFKHTVLLAAGIRPSSNGDGLVLVKPLSVRRKATHPRLSDT